MRFYKRYFIFPILAVICGYMFYSVYKDVKNQTISDFNAQQMILAKEAAKGIESLFNRYFRELQYLSGIDDIILLNDRGKMLVKAYYENNTTMIKAVTLVDAGGRITYTAPYNAKVIGADISYQKHIKTIMKTHHPVISDVFRAVQGYSTIAFHVPIFDNGVFKGSLAILVPFDHIAKQFLEDIKLGKSGHAWMISQKGVILYSPAKERVGKTVYDLYPGSSGIIDMAKKMMSFGQGETEYTGNAGKKILAVYHPVILADTFWSIAVGTPEPEVLSAMQQFTNKLILIIFLLVISALLYSYFVIRAVAILKEQRKRKKAESALKEAYDIINQSSAVAFRWKNEEGWPVEFVTDNVAALFGHTAQDFMSKKVVYRSIIHPEDLDRVSEEVSSFSNEKKTKRFAHKPYRIITKNKEVKWIEDKTFILRDKHGVVTYYQGIVEDITDRITAEEERKRLEAQLRQALKMESIGTLAGGIAHDFNNLLMGIQGRISLMLLNTEPSSRMYGHLKGIEENVKSAANLTGQLLGFARGGKYEVLTTDLSELVQKQNQMFGRTKKEIAIYEKFEKNLWLVDVDRGQMEQVILNLYINAWQAMPGGGQLYTQTENIIIDKGDSGALPLNPGRYVKLSITDTGIGMDEATRQRIFEPFFSTKEMGRGTGLGLASVYGIIKNHNGFINVYSNPGKGSTFSIYLPASASTTTKPASGGADTDIQTGNETILLVDDEKMVINVGVMMLEELGYQALTAQNGKAAIEIYEKNVNKIDMVILDMIMPQMSGSETYDRLKEINPNIKVLLASGYSLNGQATAILARGCNGFIQKPFNLKTLSEKIREILNKG